MQYRRYMCQLREKWPEVGPACGKYFLVTNVNSSTFDKIANFSENVRLSYDYVKQSLIIKYMPGTIHEMVALEFFMAIRVVIVGLSGTMQGQ